MNKRRKINIEKNLEIDLLCGNIDEVICNLGHLKEEMLSRGFPQDNINLDIFTTYDETVINLSAWRFESEEEQQERIKKKEERNRKLFLKKQQQDSQKMIKEEIKIKEKINSFMDQLASMKPLSKEEIETIQKIINK